MAEMGEDVLEERRRGRHLTCLLTTIHDVIVLLQTYYSDRRLNIHL